MTGLTNEEVQERIAQGQVNNNENPNTRTYKQIILENTLTFFNFLNLVLLVLVLLVGSYKNSMFVGIIFINTVIGIIQEVRAKKTIDKLAILTESKTVVLREGKKWKISTEKLVVDDLIFLKAGEQVPADAKILEGSLEVNESLLTGEADNLPKNPGDELFSGSFVTAGQACCQIIHVGSDNYASRITSEAKEFKRHNSELRNSLNAILKVISIIIVPMGAMLFYKQYYFVGDNIRDSVVNMVAAVLGMIPEGLVLLTSVALTLGALKLAQKKTLVQELYCIETLARVDTLCLDKTGTITKGEPQVTDMVPAKGISEEELLGYAYALEKKSEHPLAKAIIARAEEKKIVLQKVSDFQALPGNGLRAALNSEVLTGGNMKFISNETSVSPELMKQAEKLAGEGKTPLLFAKGGKLLGMIAVADVIKEDSPQAIKELQNMGIRVVMLTGDNERTAKAIGAQAGVDDVIAGVLPDGKESVIRSLKEQGKVAMVGDGINDAPALTRADIGIAIGAGTDVAIDAADVVLMKSRLSDVPAAIRLSRATLRNIHENLFWAFFYNVIGIPLAAGVWIPIFGWTLNPMFGAAAMSLSSFCVVTNALRLNLFKVHDASRDKKIKQNVEEIHDISANAEIKNVTENKSLKAENPNFCNSEIHDPKDQENIKENKENKEMTTITVNVTGMMCGHCEAHVTKAVKEAFGVEDVVSSHEKGTTVIHAPEKLDEDKIREVIKEAGYEVTGITQE